MKTEKEKKQKEKVLWTIHFSTICATLYNWIVKQMRADARFSDQ